ncbi:MAG: MBL fold metallo-hydrolase [Syntrophomonadaceae bacterium]|nr:MBL fold metallo-hydrolase [Syntrophomonadaceae bacterium]
MIIKWLGHASFLMESAGIKLLTDPFNAEIGYQLYKDKVDIVTVSHEHWDHNAVDILAGNPRVIRETGSFAIDGINILGTSTYHDKKQGQERGHNIIYKISSEDLDVLHLGDLGHVLTDRQLMEVGNVDILLVPVGGRYTVDADAAYEIVEQLQPQIIIPMHFLTPDVSIKELAPVEAFTAKFPRVIKKPFLEISKEALTPEARVIVLDYPH